MILPISIHLIIQPFELAWSKGWKLQPYVLVGIDSVPLFDMIEDPIWNWCGYMIQNVCDAMSFMDSTMVRIYNTVLHDVRILSEVHEWCLDMSLPTAAIWEKIKMQLNIRYSYPLKKRGWRAHVCWLFGQSTWFGSRGKCVEYLCVLCSPPFNTQKDILYKPFWTEGKASAIGCFF